jgi:antirestriction protein ArdC
MTNSELTDRIYAEITDKFILKLEQGTVPWRKPWAGGDSAPKNLVSKRAYRGINTLILSLSDFSSPWWLTFKQAGDLGGKVLKGSKSSIVVYYSRIEKRDANGNVKRDENGRPLSFAMLRYSRVFNLEQTEGIEAPAGPEPVTIGDAAEGDLGAAETLYGETLLTWMPNVSQGGTRACYSPSLDSIKMPRIDSFSRKAEFYHTFHHEAAHATGHATRLNREGIVELNEFGSKSYSKEELVAEITAAFVSNAVGILNEVTFENSAAYLSNWIKVLKSDNAFIVKASSGAQKAADFILKRGEVGTEEKAE